MELGKITVFTPTYNRANSLGRVYDSLCQQTYRNFDWIVIDDGSSDDTGEVIRQFKRNANFPIYYVYQENSGKHVAINRAVEKTDSEFFIIADSDDAFKPEALKTFIDTWNAIPDEEKDKFKGVICKCFDAETGVDIGDFPYDLIDSDELTAGFKLKFKFEKWSFFRTEVLREFPFPEPEDKLKFFPETVVWQQMSRKYKTRYINIALRAYYRDQDNALTAASTSRCRENVYLWQHYLNNVFDYFLYDKKRFVQAFVGISRDGFLSGRKLYDICRLVNNKWKKVVVIMLSPLGRYLAWRKMQ